MSFPLGWLRFLGMEREMRDIHDKLDSLHRRVDKFYEWAALLQKEFRDMQQRQKFIESQTSMDFSVDDLLERLDRVKEKK
jgi:hypothetical protein